MLCDKVGVKSNVYDVKHVDSASVGQTIMIMVSGEQH